MIPVAACVMSPAACATGWKVPLAPEPVVTAWFSVRTPPVANVMSPAFEATPVTVFVNTVDDVTTPVCSVPDVESLNTTEPVANVSFTEIVPEDAFVPMTLA